MPKFQSYPYAFIRGGLVAQAEATVSVMTNSLHYGGGVFGGIKAYKTLNGIGIFRLNDHAARLQASCKILRIPIKFNQEYIAKTIVELAKKNNLTGKTYIRPLIYRSDLELSPDITGEYDLAIYMLDMSGTASYMNGDDGLNVCVSSWQRNSDNALPPRTKATGGYLNSALAIHDARQAGFDNAILLNQNGQVGEGAVMNFFMVKNGVLVTPAIDADILEGITRKTFIELADELNIPVVERAITRSELYTADEIFFCGTAVEIVWCKSVDHVVISAHQGKITKMLAKAFHSLPKTHPHLFTIG